MKVTARSYLTAGMAVLGAGAIALAPVQPLPDHAAPAQQRAVSNLAVNLASSIDPFTPWIQTFQQAAANVQLLGDFYNQQPLPLLNTIGKNIQTYAEELTNGNAAAIPGQIAKNLRTFFEGPWWNAPQQPIPAVNASGAPVYSSNYISDTQTVNRLGVVINSQRGVYNVAAPLIVSQLGPTLPEALAAALPAIIQFTATPYSGVVGGIVSPIVASLVQLSNSISAAREFFGKGDLIGGINEIINIPANTTNAFLNGLPGILDLTEVVRPLLPPSLQGVIQRLGLTLSGFLTGPVPFNGSLTNANRPPTIFTGGTLFDAISARATISGLGADTTGLQVGYYQSAIGLGQFLGTNMLVTPLPPKAAATGAATGVAPKAAAAVDAAPVATAPAAPAALSEPSAPSEPTAPAPVDTPPAPAVDVPPAPVEAPAPVAAKAPEADAPEAPATGHRGGGQGKSDNGGQSGGRGHRGAA